MGGKFSKGSTKANQSRSNGVRDEKNNLVKSRHSTSSFRSRHQKRKRYLKQVKHDKKSQRVSTQQLHRLSFELTRTPWYLGRRLGFNEKEVKKVLLKGQNNQEIRYHFLMSWRIRNGWKATVQNLVIHLELAGYDHEEYKSILDAHENCQGKIYDKPPDIKPTNRKKTSGRFRYDDHQPKNSTTSETKDDGQGMSPLEANTEEIISFARRSWKKLQKQESFKNHKALDLKLSLNKTEDSGFMTSRELSGSPTGSEREANTSEEDKIRPSHSSITKTRSNSEIQQASSQSDAETELEDILKKTRHNDITLRRTRNSNDITDVKNSTAACSSRVQHNRNDSTDSQLKSYREEIARVSVKRYDVDKNERPLKKNTNEEGNGESNTPNNFFKFGSRRNCASPLKGQISGLDLTRDDDIILSDSNNKRIQIFDRFGHFLSAFSTNSELNPKGLFVTRYDEILVCCGNEVRMFDKDGQVKLIFGQGSFRNNGYSVVCDGTGVFYVTDIISHTVSVFDNEGNIRKRFGCHGSTLASFDQPVALAISKRDELLISDSQNHEVKVYSLAGRPLFAIGGKGSEDGKFWNPFGLCFDNNGYLFVADCGNNRISVFDHDYKFVRHVLDESDGLKMPSFIKVSSAGLLVVCEWKSEEIKVFSLETAV